MALLIEVPSFISKSAGCASNPFVFVETRQGALCEQPHLAIVVVLVSNRMMESFRDFVSGHDDGEGPSVIGCRGSAFIGGPNIPSGIFSLTIRGSGWSNHMSETRPGA